MRKIKHIIFSLILLFFIAVFCLFVLEIASRAIYPVEYSMYKICYLSNYSVIIYEPNFQGTYSRDEFKNNMSINSKGFRDEETSYDNPAGDARILMVGDSFTSAMEVPFDLTLSEQAEFCLNEATGVKYDVLNLGVSGQGPIAELLTVKNEGLKYGPKVIILNFYVGNDIFGLDDKAFKGGYTYINGSFEVKQLPRRAFIENFIARRFMFYNVLNYYLVKKVKIIINNPSVKEKELAYDPILATLSKEYAPTFDANMRVVRDIFKDLKELAAKNDAQLLIVLIPFKEQVDYMKYREMLEQSSLKNLDLDKPQRELIKALEEENIKYLDLLPNFRATNYNNSYYWEIDGHFNERGYAFAAKAICDELLKNKEKSSSS